MSATDLEVPTSTGDELLEPSSATPVADGAEPATEVAASADEVDHEWDDAADAVALRQARKEADLTASTDSVRAYLKLIGRVKLLTAEEEGDLAKRIDAGL